MMLMKNMALWGVMIIIKMTMGMMMILIVMTMKVDHIQSLTLLSPVDGLDPFGLVPIYCITPGEMLNFR